MVINPVLVWPPPPSAPNNAIISTHDSHAALHDVFIIKALHMRQVDLRAIVRWTLKGLIVKQRQN